MSRKTLHEIIMDINDIQGCYTSLAFALQDLQIQYPERMKELFPMVMKRLENIQNGMYIKPDYKISGTICLTKLIYDCKDHMTNKQQIQFASSINKEILMKIQSENPNVYDWIVNQKQK